MPNSIIHPSWKATASRLDPFDPADPEGPLLPLAWQESARVLQTHLQAVRQGHHDLSGRSHIQLS
jgi:hypothetical protein